jgi:hypothetical protein
MEKNQPHDEELTRFHIEARRLTETNEPTRRGPETGAAT